MWTSTLELLTTVKSQMNTGHRCREFTEQGGLLNATTGDTPEQSKTKGCENPGTLSSLTIVEESAAMKLTEQKLSPLQEVNRRGY